MAELKITYTTLVEGGKNRRRGPIGLIVFDNQASRMIAISAAHVVDDECFLAGTDESIGTSSPPGLEPDWRPKLRPSWSLLTPVRLRENIQIENGRLPSLAEPAYPILGADAHKYLGKTVLVHLPGRDLTQALIVSTHAKFAMPPPEAPGRNVFFEETLELLFLGTEPRARSGDAGAIVTSLEGAVLGVIVSASGSSTFAAPVTPLLNDLKGCVALTAEIIDRQNQPPADSPSDLGLDRRSSGNLERQFDEERIGAEQTAQIWREADASDDKEGQLRSASRIREECLCDD